MRLHLTVLSLYMPANKIKSCAFGYLGIHYQNTPLAFIAAHKTQNQFLFCGTLSNFVVFVLQSHTKIKLKAHKFYNYSTLIFFSLLDTNVATTKTLSLHNFCNTEGKIKPKIKFLFAVKKAVSFYHLCVSRWMRVGVAVRSSLQHLVHDGPETLSNTLSPTRQKSFCKYYEGSTFQCLLQIQASSEDVTTEKLMRYYKVDAEMSLYQIMSSNVSVTYPSGDCPMFTFCTFRVITSKRTFVKAAIQSSNTLAWCQLIVIMVE